MKEKQSDWDVKIPGECSALLDLFSHPACRLRSDKQLVLPLWSDLVIEANLENPPASRLNALALRLSENNAKGGGHGIAQMWLRYLLSREPCLEMEALGLAPTPTTLNEARALAASRVHQFRGWALALVDATPEKRKQGDREAGQERPAKRFDGLKTFPELDKKGNRKIVVGVKVGVIRPDDVRALNHVREDEKAEIALLLSLETPTAAVTSAAEAAGSYESATGKRFPRVQLLPIGALLDGTARPDYPGYEPDLAVKKAKSE